jgi:hypothetical protein
MLLEISGSAILGEVVRAENKIVRIFRKERSTLVKQIFSLSAVAEEHALAWKAQSPR